MRLLCPPNLSLIRLLVIFFCILCKPQVLCENPCGSAVSVQSHFPNLSSNPDARFKLLQIILDLSRSSTAAFCPLWERLIAHHNSLWLEASLSYVLMHALYPCTCYTRMRCKSVCLNGQTDGWMDEFIISFGRFSQANWKKTNHLGTLLIIVISN